MRPDQQSLFDFVRHFNRYKETCWVQIILTGFIYNSEIITLCSRLIREDLVNSPNLEIIHVAAIADADCKSNCCAHGSNPNNA